MSSPYSDLFEIDDVEDESVVGGEEPAVENFAGKVQVLGVTRRAGDFDPDDDRQLSTWFSVCVLTVPDVDRFPIPARFAAEKQPVDLSGVVDLSGGEVRRLILPSLPDEQLHQIEAAEKNREKPRAMVLNAVAAEKHDRSLPCDACGHVSLQFAEWVAKTAQNPLSCRIAAIAWQAGDSELQAFAPASLEEEAAALADLRVAWVTFKASDGFERLSSWDLTSVMSVVTARRNALAIDCRHDDFKPCYQITGRDWAQHVDAVGGLELAALSLGVAAHEIPARMSPVDVFAAWRSSPGSVELSDAAAARLGLERDLLSVVQSLW